MVLFRLITIEFFVQYIIKICSEQNKRINVRLQEMMEASQQQSGVRREVNEKILDSCTSLTKAIRVLIQKSKALQSEIVEQGRVSTHYYMCVSFCFLADTILREN